MIEQYISILEYRFLARGSRWKRIRCITNPAFSINNLKKIYPKASSHISTFMEKLQSTEGTAIDIHECAFQTDIWYNLQ